MKWHQQILLTSGILLFGLCAYTQSWQGRIVDAEVNAPLAYVTITFPGSKTFIYSDSNGVFYINRHLVNNSDTVHFTHIGYKKISLPLSLVLQNSVVKMVKAVNDLGTVEVRSCDWSRSYANRQHDDVDLHGGIIPGIILVRIGAYKIETLGRAYLERLSYRVADWSKRLDIPLRLHWYEWDEINNKPGRELTDTNFIFYPQKKRWNTITLPAKMVMAANNHLVIGFEHLYPPGLIRLVFDMSDKEQVEWYSENSWAYGLTKDEAGSFHQMWGKEVFVPPYKTKPAIRFKMRLCK